MLMINSSSPMQQQETACPYRKLGQLNVAENTMSKVSGVLSDQESANEKSVLIAEGHSGDSGVVSPAFFQEIVEQEAAWVPLGKKNDIIGGTSKHGSLVIKQGMSRDSKTYLQKSGMLGLDEVETELETLLELGSAF